MRKERREGEASVGKENVKAEGEKESEETRRKKRWRKRRSRGGIEIRRTNEIPDGNWKHAWSRRVTGRADAMTAAV